MGLLSCSNEAAIAACDPYNMEKKKKKNNKSKNTTVLREFRYEELESATAGFSPENLLGRGSHGSVYKAVLDGGKLVVAVKKMMAGFPEERSSSSSNAFNNNNNNNNNPGENEIEILSRIRSPRLVNLLGFTLDPNDKKIIVVEFMSNGTLHDLLHRNPRPPGWRKRVRFALQIAKAVETLHLSNPPVIHRDIKSSNILVDENWNARLGDFGLALRGHVEDVKIRSTPPAGTFGYLDPGYVTPENLSTKSDVFSFGILLLEMISGRNAINVNYSPPSIVNWAPPIIKRAEFDMVYDPRLGPPKDPFVMRQLAILAVRCVRSSVEKRPSISEVVNCLRIMNKRISSLIWGRMGNRMRKSSSVDLETETNPDFHDPFETELVEENPRNTTHGTRNSLRNRKLSNVKSSVHFAEKPNSTATSCSGRKDPNGSVTEVKVESDSQISNQIAPIRGMGLAVRMPRVKFNQSQSIGIQVGQLVHGSENGCVFHLENNRCPRGVDASELDNKSEKVFDKEDP